MSRHEGRVALTSFRRAGDAVRQDANAVVLPAGRQFGDREEAHQVATLVPAVQAAQGPPLTPRSPAGEVVMAYLREQVAGIARYDPLLRRDEPDAVHQMRVATRRARSALEAFGGIIEREATRPLCAELKWLATAVGQVRDDEVLLARLMAELATIPPALVVGRVDAQISAYFTAQLTQARLTAIGVLDGQRYRQLLDDLDSLLTDPPLTSQAKRQAGKVLARPVRRAERRLQRALAAVPDAEDRDAAIHQARKAAKRARYAAEAAAPALGDAARRLATSAKELQELLGDHHDSVVARAVLLELAATARAAGQDTFTYGLMHRSQACHAAEIERALPRSWSSYRVGGSRRDVGLYGNRRGPGTLAVETLPR